MSQLQDDGFHEIQLNGKQLVFLFMAATVVSVVIFLCGVLVGRGVRAERVASADAAASSALADATPQAPATPPVTPSGSDPTAAPAPPPADELSYFSRLEKKSTPAEQLKSSGEKASGDKAASDKGPKSASEPVGTAAKSAATTPEKTPTPAPAEKPAATPPPPRVTVREPTAAAPADPGGPGFAVQIAALNVRSEADAIAKRLTSKGYAAYVLAPASGTPSVFRVRVGKFSTRREAESVAARLQKEEQFKPWVTR